MTKFNKSRHVPFHATVAVALADYLGMRDRFLPRVAEDAFFVSTPSRSLKKRAVHWTFQKLRNEAGIVARPEERTVGKRLSVGVALGGRRSIKQERNQPSR